MNSTGLLYSKEEIKNVVQNLAQAIGHDYSNKTENLILVGVLKGSFVFLSDLSRELSLDHSIDFISISSYEGKTKGDIKLLFDIHQDIVGKNVIIVEDIVDSGETIQYLVNLFGERKAASIKVCALMKREGNECPVDYYGFLVPKNKWVIGYGLDYNEEYRNLDAIYYLN